MQNSLNLSTNEALALAKSEKTVTTKELASVLGVSNMAIKRVLDKTNNLNGTVKVENGKTTVFTEEQATIIKQEIQKHHNLATSQRTEATDLQDLLGITASEAINDITD